MYNLSSDVLLEAIKSKDTEKYELVSIKAIHKD